MSRRTWRKLLFWTAGVASVRVGLPISLFVLNGTVLAAGEMPVVDHLSGDVQAAPTSPSGEITLVAYNIAKGWAPRGGLSFHDAATVEARLRRMADAIIRERPDIVFLSEAMTEAGSCRVNQVEFLARACGLPFTAFGENYNFGVPGYRVVGGNAILSRFPLTPVGNVSLAGRKPFYVTSNNRRALFVSADIHGQTTLLGSLHNDSFNLRNNEAQVRQLLDFIGDRPCVLAGDFNAQPHQRSIELIRESEQFTGAFDGPPTYMGEPPARRIDFVFGPKALEHVETRVIEEDASDHRPLVARFRLPN
jgi:endonuclease/exonuclease/phosphatase family metal-dependent hydrolase